MEACLPAEMARGCIVLLDTPDNLSGIVAIDPDVCTGCGLCAYHGPALIVAEEGAGRPQDPNFRRVAGLSVGSDRHRARLGMGSAQRRARAGQRRSTRCGASGLRHASCVMELAVAPSRS